MLEVLICDDSLVARKQVAKCLPQDMEGAVHFAKHGEDALDLITNSKVDLLLLDLNMPVLDGYGTLKKLQEQGVKTKTIVVSGDIQPEAKTRVFELGAIDFIQKPVTSDDIAAVLKKHKILSCTDDSEADMHTLSEITRDCYQEVVNVAMGQAGANLARIMGMFVKLPIPNVNLIEVSELHMMLNDVGALDTTLGVCQGFLGDGISGEALCILSDSSFADVAKILKIEGKLDGAMELELLMDTASLLIGTCLSGIAKQLDMQFRQGHPIVLGQHQSIQEMISANKSGWRKTLAIEVSYTLEGFDINCELILLFTEESMTMMNAKLNHLLEQ